MKQAKRWLSVCLIVLLLALLISPASASLVEDTELSLTPMEMNDLMARTAITTYFSQREAFLKGEADTIPIAYAPVARDEQAHLDQLINHGLQLVSSSITFDTISCWDNTAEVILTETIVYQVDGEETSCTVPHSIIVFLISNGLYEVGSDGYYDSAAGFYSCSYIPPESYLPNNSAVNDSDLCIINIALNEVGYRQEDDGTTKYMDFFNSTSSEWCAAFVAWCANEAQVPTSIIPKVKTVSGMRTAMEIANSFYPSRSEDPSSTFVPQAGDLFFMYDGGWGNHVGLVASVNGNTVWVIDGNWEDRVCYRDVPLTCSLFVGFGRPQYGTTGHTYPPGWSHDGFCHWKQCLYCTYRKSLENHIFVQQSPIAPFVCQVCGYETTVAGGIMRFAQQAIKKE